MKQIIKQINRLWNNFILIFTVSKANIGGEVVNSEVKVITEPLPTRKETNWFATANNLMHGDWTGHEAKVESSRFGDESDWKDVPEREKEEEQRIFSDVDSFKGDPCYAKVIYPERKNTVEYVVGVDPYKNKWKISDGD